MAYRLDELIHQKAVDSMHSMIEALTLVPFSSVLYFSLRLVFECILYVHPRN